MSDVDWLSDEAWAVIEPHLPQGRPGAPRVDDRRVIDTDAAPDRGNLVVLDEQIALVDRSDLRIHGNDRRILDQGA